MSGFGPFDVALDSEKNGILMDDLIDEFVPTPRQQAFAELAQMGVAMGLLTRRQWLEKQDEHPVFASQPLDLRREVISWFRDGIFEGWLFRALAAFELSDWEKTLMDAVFWDKISHKMATGNMDALRLYSKIRIEGNSGAGDMEELRSEAQAWLREASDEGGFGSVVPEA